MTATPTNPITTEQRLIENTALGIVTLFVIAVVVGAATLFLPLADDISQAAGFLFDYHLVMLLLLGIDGVALSRADRNAAELDRRFARVALPLGAIGSSATLAILFVLRSYEPPEEFEHALWQCAVGVSAAVLVLVLALLIENVRGGTAKKNEPVTQENATLTAESLES
ncbi:hypothetical protein [Microbacterium lacticum]|uniref:Uncharacterized protein n=1 Tax=Microbacterium lacticum TaxID=33885 RepID=A0A4Y3UM43_9MICO|nr:hypothetical protein [Microbacterium lacticum]TQM90956.1 hypothetical protein FHX68_2810 [Microbacterium lacticum]GEB95174.1 hypothetical protein MLA01_13930 [Microbacterium lacticum]GGN23211.1 hypothetical protein GCM10009724_16940 [Microbacterium lacticum]